MRDELKTKDVGLSRKEKVLLVGGIAVSAACMTMSFMAGRNYEDSLFSSGLAKCFKEDPTLEEHIMTAISKVNKVMNNT